MTRGQFSPVYFSYDSFAISDSESGKIQRVASAMKSMSNTLIIAGFTDERGTEEYNRGLGEKRAQAVRDALISQGSERRSHPDREFWRGNARGLGER